MKKFLIAVLISAITAIAQTSATQAAPAGQKTIKDQTEYNDYITATGLTDPTQKAAALESFVQKYPNSVVKEDALNAAMGAYQQAGNMQKSMDAAGRILQINPNNVPACVVMVYGSKAAAMAKGDAQGVIQAGQMAVRCLPALDNFKPEGVDQATIDKQKKVFSQILNNAAGTGALNAKNYPEAVKYFTAAIAAAPDSADDTYNLSLAYLGPRPNTDENTQKGLYYLARALNMVAGNAAATQQIGTYGKSVYKRYHGGDDGWDQFVAAVKTANAPTPPADLASMIKKAPSPAEQVKAMIAQQPDPTTRDFSDWLLILTYGDQATKDSQFEQLKGKPFKFQGQVIAADESSVDVALTQDAIDAKKAEVKVMMEEPFKKTPTAGAQFPFQADPASYTTEPFLITMDKGIDLTPAPKTKPKPPARRPTTPRKKTS